MKIIKGGVTSALGFKASGMSCGIKKSGKPDLALIACDIPATTVGVFTKNSIKAAPLIVTQNNLADHKAQAIIINSGNANCFTGNPGMQCAKQSTALMAKLLNIESSNVLVASTGIIGKQMPYQKIVAAAPSLVKALSKTAGHKAAQAILTTDLVAKEIAVQIIIAGKRVTIGAMAKGSGMIAPNMATMLGFITTDAAITAKMLKAALKNAIEQSFNNITIDGCMSTNDMVTVMASGLAGNKTIASPQNDFKIFCQALNHICLDLAKKIVWDAEGITKFITVTTTGAKTAAQAKKTSFAIANSNLVKTAAYGNNPNWGRVAAAVGSLGLPVTEKQLKIKFSPFQNKEIQIWVDLGLGQAKASVYTSDLSVEYVRINGRYN